MFKKNQYKYLNTHKIQRCILKLLLVRQYVFLRKIQIKKIQYNILSIK